MSSSQRHRLRFAQLFVGLRRQGSSRTGAALCALLLLVLVAGEVAPPAPPVDAPAVCAGAADGIASVSLPALAPRSLPERLRLPPRQLPPPLLRQRSLLDRGLPPVRAPDC